MSEKDYQPGQRVSYSEQHGNWEAEVVENNCSGKDIDYMLKIIREISPPALGGRLEIGKVFRLKKPADSVFIGAGSIEGLVSEVES